MAYSFAFGAVNAMPVYGLHKTEWNFRKKMIKGSIAEILVQQIFLTHKYDVSRYGKDNTPKFNMPDYVIHHRLSKETYFVEVKFSTNGCFSEKDLGGFHFDDALIIVVSKQNIKCLSVRELKKGWQITPTCSNFLADRAEFELRKDVIEDFTEFAERFF